MIQAQPEIIAAQISNSLSAIAVPSHSSDSTISEPYKLTEPQHSSSFGARRYKPCASSWGRYVFGSLEYRRRRRRFEGKERNEFFARYKLPGWLSSSSWDYHMYNGLSALQIKLQTSRFVETDSPFFEAVGCQDLIRVREMLLNREGYVTDRIVKYVRKDGWNYYTGSTALHVS